MLAGVVFVCMRHATSANNSQHCWAQQCWDLLRPFAWALTSWSVDNVNHDIVVVVVVVVVNDTATPHGLQIQRTSTGDSNNNNNVYLHHFYIKFRV